MEEFNIYSEQFWQPIVEKYRLGFNPVAYLKQYFLRDELRELYKLFMLGGDITANAEPTTDKGLQLKVSGLLAFFYNLYEIKKFMMEQNQDWIIVISGHEGSGKSTLALQIASFFDKDFDPETQIAFTFKEMIKTMKMYKDTPFKPIIFDEAVSSFYSREAMHKFNKLLVKIFIANRSFRHLYIFNIPSFFTLDRYIRMFRMKTLIYAFPNKFNPSLRLAGVYFRKSYASILKNKEDAEIDLLLGEYFVHKYKPDLLFPFPPVMDKDLWERYMYRKKQFQTELLEEAERELEKQEQEEEMKQAKGFF